MSTDKYLNKGNVIYTYNEILYSLKEEVNSAICDNMMKLEGNILGEISQSQKDKYCRIPLI